ncbi:MAG: hypothetical protein QUV71_09360 [Rhizobium sp.]|nr:hypothetical protein [Rhizobium sp.]MDM8013348.1 hypothetical protein [Rhizobium sp.]
MIIVILKLLEIGTRAIFIVLATYALDLSQAGLFGFLVTLQGLASFAFGYERYIDIQRRLAGEPAGRIDQQVRKTFFFFCANYLGMLPVFAIGLVLSSTMSPMIILLLCVIAVAEQLMNQGYFLTILDRRYVGMLVVSSAKNVFLLAALVALFVAAPHKAQVETILSLWAATLVVSAALLLVVWRVKRRTDVPPLSVSGRDILDQYKHSRTHFLVGLVAVVVLQFDRIAVGSLLPFDQAGIYFRHVMVVGLVYQVFGIFSANAITLNVYRRAKEGSFEEASREARRFYPLMILALVAMLAVFLAGWTFLGSYGAHYHLNAVYFVALFAAASLRIRADLNLILFNAFRREKTILKLQLASFGVSAIMLIGLTRIYGISGTIAAGLIGAIFYLSISTVAIRRLRRQQTS